MEQKRASEDALARAMAVLTDPTFKEMARQAVEQAMAKLDADPVAAERARRGFEAAIQQLEKLESASEVRCEVEVASLKN
jgi:hypothetical protein